MVKILVPMLALLLFAGESYADGLFVRIRSRGCSSAACQVGVSVAQTPAAKPEAKKPPVVLPTPTPVAPAACASSGGCGLFHRHLLIRTVEAICSVPFRIIQAQPVRSVIRVRIRHRCG